MSDLKPIPCRFCDGPAYHGALLPEFRILREVQTPAQHPERYYWFCPQCTLPMPLGVWNRRAPSPALKALVEACRPFFAETGPGDIIRLSEALAAVEREIGA